VGTQTPARRSEGVADVAGILVSSIGAVVLVGWLTHRRGLIQLNPTQVPMQFNTAIALLLLGLTLLAARTRWRTLGIVTGALVVTLAGLTVAQYALDRPLGVDTLFFDPWITFGTDVPGRMARNTALCFVALGACGAAMLVAGLRQGRVPLVVGVVSSGVAGLVLVALFGYVSGVSTAYTWRTSTAMAPMTAIALLAASLGFGARAWRAAVPSGAPRWLPVPVAVLTLAVTLFLWQALTTFGEDNVLTFDRAAGVILGLGLVLAVVLAAATAAIQSAVEARRAAEMRHTRDVALREAYAAVALAEDLASGFEAFARAAADVVPFDRAALTLVEESAATVAAAVGTGSDTVPAGTSMPLTEPILAELLSSRSAVLVEDIATRYATSPAARAGMRSFVATPIVIGGSARAMLTIASAREGSYDAETVARIDELTALTGGALYTLARLDGERSTTARLRELDQLKNEFVGVVAHDLRSPMTVIAGYVDTILQRWDAIEDPMKKDLLAVVSRNTKRLSTMVEDVLQVARIESGDFPYEIQPFDLRALVLRTAAEMNTATPDKHVCAEVPASLPAALGDEDRYWRVLTNLLSNAQKFSPPDAAVEVRVAPRGREIEVSVADRGPGIPEDQLPRLFGKFARLAGPPDGQKGTGLGLYICKALVEAQGGRIWARSAVGAGTTVTFTVPRAGEA
jgi:signal transduction histidine kinase